MKALTASDYQEVNSVLNELVKNLQEVLGKNFLGAYAQGSLAVGDFDFNSDVDFIIVVHKDLDEKEAELVQAVHQKIYQHKSRWARRLEYSFYPKDKLNTLSSPYPNGDQERELWYFDNGSQQIVRSDHCNTIVVRWTVREKGIVLAGPPPGDLIDLIPVSSLQREIIETINGWGSEILEAPEVFANRFYQSYLTLNFNRMLCDLSCGETGSKRNAVHWAQTNLDSDWLPHLDFCWQERQDPSLSIYQDADPELYTKSIRFVEFVMTQSRQLAELS